MGKGFAFVARQQRISTETQDFYIDLLFYSSVGRVTLALTRPTNYKLQTKNNHLPSWIIYNWADIYSQQLKSGQEYLELKLV